MWSSFAVNKYLHTVASSWIFIKIFNFIGGFRKILLGTPGNEDAN